MGKRIGLIIVALIAVMGFSKNVYAESNTYYTTTKDIELTKEEYDFLTQFYWNDYPDYMTKAQYEEFKNSDLLDRKLKVKTLVNPNENSVKSQEHGTNAKVLKIAAACSNTCQVNLNLVWTVNPSVRSYDVIGAYLSGVSLISHDMTYVVSTSGTTFFNNIKTAYNGIGNSVKLPASGSNIIVNMTFTTTTGGVIYGSYQHAMSNTTLPVSKYYNFSLAGYGNVFSFYGSASGIYDGMGGVDITV